MAVNHPARMLVEGIITPIIKQYIKNNKNLTNLGYWGLGATEVSPIRERERGVGWVLNIPQYLSQYKAWVIPVTTDSQSIVTGLKVK